MKQLAGNIPVPASPYTPWRFGNPDELLQDLQEVDFINVKCNAYSHPLTFTLPDLVAFHLGPHGQSRHTLDRLKALGQEDIDIHAPEVVMITRQDS